MTLVYQNKKFIPYVPYFTHSVSSEGRPCSECHMNQSVSRIKRGEKVPVVGFKKGKIATWKGVVPVVQGKLEWAFLNRTKKGWVPVPSKEDPLAQYAAYGTPLTEEQLNKMAQAVRPEDFEQRKQEQGSMKWSRENMVRPMW